MNLYLFYLFIFLFLAWKWGLIAWEKISLCDSSMTEYYSSSPIHRFSGGVGGQGETSLVKDVFEVQVCILHLDRNSTVLVAKLYIYDNIPHTHRAQSSSGLFCSFGDVMLSDATASSLPTSSFIKLNKQWDFKSHPVCRISVEQQWNSDSVFW